MTALLLSLLALLIGPFLVHFARRVRPAAVAMDAFVIVTVGGLILIHVFPDALNHGGWGAAVAAVVGFLVPTVAERGLRPTSGARWLFVVLALAALFAHAITDGIALSNPLDGHDHGPAHDHDPQDPHDHGPRTGTLLVWSVILHRLPVGISIWWIVARSMGVRLAVITLLVNVVGTLLGFSVGNVVLAGASGAVVGLFEGLLSGSLLHVVMHAHIPPPKEGRHRLHVASAVGFLLALAALFAIPHDHGPGDHGAGDHVHASGETFLDLALKSAPALLLAYLVVGAAHVFVPLTWLRRITRGNRLTQALRGMAAGLPLPVCSCGILPIYRFLIVRGSALTAAVAFLVATPELEIAAIFLTFQLMGTEIAIARVLAAATIAIAVGILVGWVARKTGTAEPAGDQEVPAELAERPQAGRLRRMLRFGLVDAVDDTAPWILVGLGLSAILAPHLTPELFKSLEHSDVILAALLGLPLYVCASGSTPLAAMMVAQGLSPGAAVAFLLTGPATNITTFGILKRLHGNMVAVVFSVAMLVLAVSLGYLVNAVLGTGGLVDGKPRYSHEHGASWLEILSVALLVLIFLWSVLRRGTRNFIEQIMEAPTSEHDHDRDHDRDHDHDPDHDPDHDHGREQQLGPGQDRVASQGPA